MQKLRLYGLFKLNLETERYLLLDIQREYTVALAKLSHHLEIEKIRQLEKRICKCCNLDIEHEYHVLMHCHSSHELRLIYIKDEERTPRNFCLLFVIYSHLQVTHIMNLSCYVYHVFIQKYIDIGETGNFATINRNVQWARGLHVHCCQYTSKQAKHKLTKYNICSRITLSKL